MSSYLPLCSYFASKVGGMGFCRNRPYLHFTRSKNFWTLFNAYLATNAAIWPMNSISPDLCGGAAHIAVTAVSGAASICISDCYMPMKLEERGVGTKRGGQILRAAQIGSFVVPVALSLGIHWAIAQNNLDEGLGNHQMQENVLIIEQQDIPTKGVGVVEASIS